jgi:hypothetical protein
MPAFSLFVILGGAAHRLRLRNRCGLGLNRNPPFLGGHGLTPKPRKAEAVLQPSYLIYCFWIDIEMNG